jgi:hypothetical protein
MIRLGTRSHQRFWVFAMANNSLERTQPERDFMYDVALLRRSARGR